MFPMILGAARAALPAVARSAAIGAAGEATGAGASRILSPLQFGAGVASGANNANSPSSPSTADESNPVYNR